MFGGVDYEIDLSKPKGERIKNVMFRGKPLSDDLVLKLAVNNYRYSSAIRALGLAEGKHDWESSNSIRDIIVAYFAEHSPVEPTVDHNWHITGVDLSEDDPTASGAASARAHVRSICPLSGCWKRAGIWKRKAGVTVTEREER